MIEIEIGEGQKQVLNIFWKQISFKLNLFEPLESFHYDWQYSIWYLFYSLSIMIDGIQFNTKTELNELNELIWSLNSLWTFHELKNK